MVRGQTYVKGRKERLIKNISIQEPSETNGSMKSENITSPDAESRGGKKTQDGSFVLESPIKEKKTVRMVESP
jgi:hypothetical protein